MQPSKRSNMRLTAFIGLLLISMSLVAQPGGRDVAKNIWVDGQKHGKWIETFEGSDKVRYEATFDHGRPIKVTHYHTNGQKRAIMVFDQAGKTCLVTEWHANGKIGAEGTYASRGVRSGTWKIYDKKGLLIAKESYVQGVQDGAQVYYYPGGQQVLERGNMVDGKKHGQWLRFLEDGTKSKIENFNQGQYHGEWRLFNVTGQLMVIGHFEYDLRHGKWLFYEKGQVVRVEHYRRGKLIEKKED